MAEHIVGAIADFPPGSHRVVKVRSAEIGIFNVDGQFFALSNICPHQYGPACTGPVGGAWSCSAATDWKHAWGRSGEILTCPWHGVEFDITTGRSLSSPRLRLRTYPVAVQDGQVTVTL